MTLKTLSILYLSALFCVLSQAASAVDVKGTIQYRQNYMNAISGHTGAIRRLKDVVSARQDTCRCTLTPWQS